MVNWAGRLTARSLNMGRIRLISLGAVLGLAWASLRGFMQQLAGPTSTFTFTGTFGVIIPTGVAIGALQYLQGFVMGRMLTTWRVWQYGPPPSR